MSTTRFLMSRLLLASAVALAIPVFALAGPPAGDRGDHEMHAGPGMSDMNCEHSEHYGRGDWERPDGEHLPPMLRRLDLSDAQRNQVREQMRAQSETMHARGEALRKTHEELWNLTMSDDYSEAKVKELAAAHGRAVAEMAELHARSARQVYQLLTPEQRKKLEEHRKARAERGTLDFN